VFCLYTREWRDIQRKMKFSKQLDRLRSTYRKHVAGIAKDPTSLLEVIRNVLLIKHATERTKLLEAVLETSERDVPPEIVRPLPGMVGSSSKMKALYEEIRFKANIELDVLIIGESGTGKELVASALKACSARANMPYVPINAKIIPENLIESEMFGTKKGAYTGAVNKEGNLEKAEGGTMFIDEVQAASLAFQIKMLRVLQERKIILLGKAEEKSINVRFIFGTSQAPTALSSSDLFDTGFIQRINKIPINIPPLRKREDDVLELATHFIEMNRTKFHVDASLAISISDEAKSAMKRYSWPGNVRELENCISDAMAKALMRNDYVLSVADVSANWYGVVPIGTDHEEASSKDFPAPLPTKADKGKIEDNIRKVEEFVCSDRYNPKATLVAVGRYVQISDGSGNPRSFGTHVSNHAESYATVLFNNRGSVSNAALSIFRRCVGVEQAYMHLLRAN